jgi:AmmeMemoRadiSam system protein A
LIEIVRTTLAAHLADRPLPPLRDDLSELREPGAAFVTLHRKDGELRGCIGQATAHAPLGEVVRDLAISSATRDRRFDCVTFEELPEIDIEVSVLSPLAKAVPDRIEVGVHGLIVRRGGYSGLLLPQVASERGWDAATFLRHTCRKAGLPDDAWRDPSATVLWFACDVIREEEVGREEAATGT